MNISTLMKEVHQNAVDHGWWDTERSLPEVLMLCVSELSEALEAYRDGELDFYLKCKCHDTRSNCNDKYDGCQHGDNKGCKEGKPEGIAVELADCIIRILDYCGHAGIDIEAVIAAKHEYNKTRPYRHGNKKC